VVKVIVTQSLPVGHEKSLSFDRECWERDNDGSCMALCLWRGRALPRETGYAGGFPLPIPDQMLPVSTNCAARAQAGRAHDMPLERFSCPFMCPFGP